MICSLCRILVSKYSKIYYCLEDVLFSRELSPQLTNHVYQNTTEYLRQIYSTVVGIPMPWCSGNGQTRPSTLASTIQTEVATTSPPCMLHRHCSSMDILRHTSLHVQFCSFHDDCVCTFIGILFGYHCTSVSVAGRWRAPSQLQH